MSKQPTIGRVVLYRTDGRNGLVYDLPAVVTCTRDTHPGDYPDGRRNPLPVPDEGCVHLTVFTPGGYGTSVRDPEGVGRVADSSAFPDGTRLVPGSGTYVEWNVPSVEQGDPKYVIAPRTWRWPERDTKAASGPGPLDEVRREALHLAASCASRGESGQTTAARAEAIVGFLRGEAG